MSTIKVNLLPSEIILQRKQGSKFIFINRLSVFLLVILMFLTSATLSLRFSQGIEVKQTQDNLVYAQNKVESMRGKESDLVSLKGRLNSIQTISALDIKRKAMFNLITTLLPSDIQVSDFSIDRSGNTTLSLNSVNLYAIDNFVNNLGNKETNSNLIARVALEGLSLGKDSVYRFNLKITAK